MEESLKDEVPAVTKGVLPALILETNSSILRPFQYFVAWQGVLTIAYSGFSPSLLNLKHKINKDLGGITKENPGSMWPKTTLACLKDGTTLTLTHLQQLRQICSEVSLCFSDEDAVEVDKLSVVCYECCCLERTLMLTEFPLRLPVVFSEPSDNEKLNVKSVLDEFAEQNLLSYYSQVIREGKRTAHYRSSRAGITLVHFLRKLPQSLATFRERVEAAMPGMYDWFSQPSLHVTIRALA